MINVQTTFMILLEIDPMCVSVSTLTSELNDFDLDIWYVGST